MENINIKIENTTNNTIIKFVSDTLIVNRGSYEYNNIDETKGAPFIQQLFYLPFVKKVFVGANFIAIQRFDIVEWEDVQEEVRSQIEAYINTGKKVIEENNDTKKEAIEVYAEVTPNPSVMKFGTNKALTQSDIELKNIEEASLYSPLAKALFNFPFVKEIFISENYISITKYDVVEWNEVYQEVRTFIRTYLQDNKVILSEIPQKKAQEENQIEVENLDETSTKIVEILEEHIKPAVASDGGNIAFKSYNPENKQVNVILQGACSGCPSSTITLKNGIEALLKEMLPNQINEVIAING
ncbi:NifU family protein [uncultured Tenacibaculum sp.]|uniref:NifU family protein n=1 Tax=uncultured Tenacibaculum sp. TaxID=174713 RepID=UPI00261B2EDB|nr:NifU family protein [uncultured Tenacibaculum sp.]